MATHGEIFGGGGGGAQKSASSLGSQDRRFLLPFLLPVSLPTGGGEWCTLHSLPPLSCGNHSEGSQSNIFLHIWLVRETIVKNAAEYEASKKLTSKSQELKNNASGLKGEGSNETPTSSYPDGKVPVF